MLAVSMLAVITLGICSCTWFSKNNGAPPLTGKWKLTAMEDSSGKPFSFFGQFNSDSVRFAVSFITDSMIIATSADKPIGDTGIYRFTKDKTAILVKGSDGIKYDTFAIKVLTDTLFRVYRDNIYFQFTKQP